VPLGKILHRFNLRYIVEIKFSKERYLSFEIRLAPSTMKAPDRLLEVTQN
jgi:hypothetical protein